MSVSIVIPVFNQLQFTKICMESLIPTLPPDAEIIVIDNGSSDSTAEYLSGYSHIRLIRNRDNLGCAAAWNQGVGASEASWVIFLNNDVVLSSGWVEGLLGFAEENKADIVSPGFREGEYNYDIQEYSREFVRRMRCVARMGVANGICFAVRRSVFGLIGQFDENFRIGQFEDTDFFRRAKRAGFVLGSTGRSFIHHFGSVTQNAIRRKEIAGPYESENRAYFRKKHSLTTGRRFIERRSVKLQALLWRTSERIRHNHTLMEKWIDGRLRYF